MNKTQVTIVMIFVFIMHFVAAELNTTYNEEPQPCLTGDCDGAGRTFGVGRRRMVMFFLPVMFKLGVIMTLLVGLTVLAFKGLTIGVMLLIFAFGGLFSKLKGNPGHINSPGGPVHLHVHGVEHSHQYSSSYPTSYGSGPWDRTDPNAVDWDEYMARKWHSKNLPSFNRNWMLNNPRSLS